LRRRDVVVEHGDVPAEPAPVSARDRDVIRLKLAGLHFVVAES